mmetsp:Transcript_40966/g.63055  ORF Transcript_40966/g.63055 Transcript_40966/m.63055 type:complete len:191 (+) Transcript_40966:339-911(+)|eukprot:CAMPEP_0117004182 /NCGR_PEP_ID=MMETSP0472-20121206/5250_1 /TAXON_ID=693140 ORGANISM="Tiarina fusus, Strain LIS" /NCGR_SAMPLE_ID=MMETSP0472 /ASSEMBLY_ACC=CAM_ASM_000603 /LENGTH=190 /DNA_ID=CAMNT_0004705071 /DNA_START=264 /DNA_END=836 /DNA_ORIENTATION=+
MIVVLILFVEEEWGVFWTTIAFLVGAITSMLSGYIGMSVAVFSNYRCSYKAIYSMQGAFNIAFRAGIVQGFSLVSLLVLTLTIVIALYSNWYVAERSDYERLFDNISGYAFGANLIGLFARVGGGIYTKAADVGADLVGKVEEDMDEDSPNNPATIADNVGDNVGDVAGMGADLYGSLSGAMCSALVVAS